MNTSMSLSLFAEAVICSLQKKMGENFQIFSTTVKKNNGIELTGVIIKEKNCNTSPTIYIDDFYEEYKNGIPFEEIMEGVEEFIMENLYTRSVDLSDFTDYERAKKSIAFKVVHYEKNWELLKEVPHQIFYNLAIVFYYTVMDPPFGGRASILIQHSHLEAWKISEEELFKNAMLNTPKILPAKIENIEKVMVKLLKTGLNSERGKQASLTLEIFGREWLEELLGQLQSDLESETDKIPMYVLSNEKKIFGAACMLYPNVLKQFAEEKQRNLFILPSSVHEVILLPETRGMNKMTLLDMVTEINRTQVEKSEVLADSVYYYDRTADELERLG